MTIGQPLQTNWEFHPLMSAKMRISSISWIVSIETDPRVGGTSPSPSFLSKNQLVKEGPDSVASVVIPTLALTLDKSLNATRSLYPVRALCYYSERISDIRQNKEVFFVSFKKGFDKDISTYIYSFFSGITNFEVRKIYGSHF